EQLQVNTADKVDHIIIAAAFFFGVQVGAVRQVDAVGVNVDMVEEVFMHKVPVALGVVPLKAAVFIQVDGGNLGKIKVILVVPIDELLIDADRRGTGGQAKHAVRLHDNLGRDDVGGFAGHVIVIFGSN